MAMRDETFGPIIGIQAVADDQAAVDLMKGSPNKAEAEKYLVFVNDPNNQKNLPPKIPYGVTTKAATALIDKNVLPELATAPENAKTALLINDKFWLENLDKLNQRFNAWVAK